jgi:hypothetical protein
MPRGDRTGPNGMGPRTGWGLGYCTGTQEPGFTGFGFGFGSGRGRRGGGRGRGGDRGWRNRNFAKDMAGLGRGYPAVPTTTKDDEISWLESQAKGLKDALERVQKQLDEIKDQPSKQVNT